MCGYNVGLVNWFGEKNNFIDFFFHLKIQYQNNNKWK